MGEQQVSHHAQVAQDVQCDSRCQADHGAARQVIEHRAQAAEHNEAPKMAVVVVGRLKSSQVLQDQSCHSQDAKTGDGHQVEQEDRVDLLLLEQNA